MSRIGKMPVNIPNGVNVEITGLNIKINGPRGILVKLFHGPITLVQDDNLLVVKPNDSTKLAKSMHGTARSIINNMIVGVTTGFKETLIIKGVGYRASVKGKYLNMTLGKSHNTKIEIPEDIKVAVNPKQDLITAESNDKAKLGQYVSIIRAQRPPEPYKGKGIIRQGEYVQRKEGKKNS